MTEYKANDRFKDKRHDGFKDPEVRRKAAATREANKAKREEARRLQNEDAFIGSQIAITDNQRRIIDNLTEISMDPNHPNFKWAVDMLHKYGLIDFNVSKADNIEERKADPEAAKAKLLKLVGKDND